MGDETGETEVSLFLMAMGELMWACFSTGTAGAGGEGIAKPYGGSGIIFDWPIP
jgi:hypothetical protein